MELQFVTETVMDMGNSKFTQRISFEFPFFDSNSFNETYIFNTFTDSCFLNQFYTM